MKRTHLYRTGLSLVCAVALLSSGCALAQSLGLAAADEITSDDERERSSSESSAQAVTSGDDEEYDPAVLTSRTPEGMELDSVPEEEIEVYRYDYGEDNLPVGIGYAVERGRVVSSPGYPNWDKPHFLVGSFEIRSSDRYPEEVIRGEFVERAADAGANAVIVDYDRMEGWMFRLSDAEPEPVVTDTDRLLERRFEEATADSDEGPFENTPVRTETRSLSEYSPVEIEMERGSCYLVTFALDEEAEFNLAARQLLGALLNHPDDAGSSSLSFDYDETTAMVRTGQIDALSERVRAGHLAPYCPQESGLRTLDLYNRDLPDDAEGMARNDLGDGELAVQVYTASKSEQELVEEQEALERSMERRRTAHERPDVCKECASKKGECTVDYRRCDEYRICVERRGGDHNWCLDEGY